MDLAVKMVRIYIHEADSGRSKTLMREILDKVSRVDGVLGVTVFRGILGKDPQTKARFADLLRSIVDLPEAIEFFGPSEAVEAALAALVDIVPRGHNIIWDAALR